MIGGHSLIGGHLRNVLNFQDLLIGGHDWRTAIGELSSIDELIGELFAAADF